MLLFTLHSKIHPEQPLYDLASTQIWCYVELLTKCVKITQKDNVPLFSYQYPKSFLGSQVSLIPGKHMLEGVNLQKRYWEFNHELEVGVRRNLTSYARVLCNKETGLMVGFSGPFLYKGFIFEDGQGLQSKNEVLGEPPKPLIANVEREWKERKYTLFKRDENGYTLPSAQANMSARATEKVFNIGAQFQGNGNGAK
ncbi:hypothetical protein VNO80_30139 [Phaseolus coccineus]|uniref:Uncharacterized protein n=1 Tax=Phaseolus coccineus TaxID=3886 RepID=A0AAN9LDC8_PHACN